MRRKIVKMMSLLLAVVVFCGAFTRCGKSAKATQSIVDMMGNEVEVPIKIKTIYVDWTDGIVLPMTLGATEKLVVAPSIFDTENYAWTRNICPDIVSVEKNDEAYMSMKTALSYKPDLVITSMEDNVAVYQSEGVPAICVKFNDNESFQEALKIVGKALGEEEYEMAEKYCQYFNSNKKMIAERLADSDKLMKPSVYYMDGRFADVYHTVGIGEIQEEWITAAGGELATAGEFEGKNLEVTVEKILEINPDFILIGERNQLDVYNTLMNDEKFLELSAIKNNNVFCVPRGISAWCTAGPEAALQLIWAAKLFHPEEFSDVDIKVEAKEFYQEFYGTNVSDAMLEELLGNK